MFKHIPTYLLSLFLLLFSASSFAQHITIKGKEYPATPEWSFLVRQYIYDSSLSVQIGKTDKAGMLQLTIDSSHPQHYIGGTVYLFLEDNSIITCTDKQLRESNENSITSWYVLTAKEIQMLTKKRITDIRFAIMGQTSFFSSRTAHFTAINRKHYLDIYNSAAGDRNDTATDVSALYN